MSQKTEWFVEPLNGHTNEVLGHHLAERVEGAALSQVRVSSQSDHRDANLWAVTWQDVEVLEGSRRTDPNLKFRIFNRRTSGGQITEATQVVRSWPKKKKSARASAGSK